MFDKFIGLVMIGLGILHPASGQVAGDTTNTLQIVSSGSSGESSGSSGSSGGGTLETSATSGEQSNSTGTSAVQTTTTFTNTSDQQGGLEPTGERTESGQHATGTSGQGSLQQRRYEELNRLRILRATGQQNREQLRTTIQQERTQSRAELEASHAAYLSRVAEIKDNALAHIEQLRELEQQRQQKFHDRLDQVRQDAQTRREQEHQAFTENLGQIRNTATRSAVQRIDENMQRAETNQTDRMKKMLDTLGTKLDTIAARAAAAKTNGTDTTAVDGAVTEARASITTAQAAVSDLAGKTHTITFTGEGNIGADVSAAYKSLISDIGAVRQKVKDAYDGVRNALKELAKAVGGSEFTTPSPTP